MLFCQLVISLTIGGAGRELVGIIQEAPADQGRVIEAAESIGIRINDYFQRNTGIILSISALISLLIFIKIFSARKLDLFSAIHLNRKPSGTDIRYGVFAGASAHFIIFLIALAFQGFGLFTEAFSQHDAHIESTFGSGGIIATILGIGIVVPLVEEIMFRGMITYELGRVASWKAAMIIQGIVFGLYHFVPVQIAYTIPMGVYFGFIVYKTGTIWPAAAGHIAMNTVSILLSTQTAMDFIQIPQITLFYMVFFIYMFVSALMYFIKKKPVLHIPDKVV